jgi:hypothetical protein
MQPTLRTLASAAGLSLGLASVASAQTTTLVNHDFTNAGRTAVTSSNPGPQAGPITGLDANTGTAANSNVWNGTKNDWVVATNNGGMAGSAGGPTYFDAINVATGINGASLRVINVGAFYDLKTYFTSTTLAPGDSISVSFNLRTTGANPTGGDAFRIGLFNSGGVKQTANLNAYNSTSFDAYTGYFAQYTPNATGSTTTANSIRERVSSSNQGLFQGTTTALANSSTPVVGGTVSFDTTYAVTFSISRSLDGTTNTITSSFGGASIISTDTTTPLSSFDTLGIFFGSNWGAASPNSRSNFIDDVLVTHTAAVPEPSAFAALAGLGALGFASTRRRRVR